MQAVAHLDVASVTRKRGRPERDLEPILATAILIFAREGFQATTIEMIAAEARVSSATLYKRFTSKQGLFTAVLAATTQHSLAIHMAHRKEITSPFSALLGRLEAHYIVSSDPRVRGVMRAWIGEVNQHDEIADVFGRKSGAELVWLVDKQLEKLVAEALIDLGDDPTTARLLAGQVMLGIVERFTLMRGLILGDDVAPVLPAENIAHLAVQAMMGIWGTPKGRAAFEAIEVAPITLRTC